MGNALLNEINDQGDALYHQALDEAMEQRQGSVQFGVRFQLLLEAMMDQRSGQVGIRGERVYRICVRQVGAFNTPQNFQQSLNHVLRSAMEELLQQNSFADRNGIYFHLAPSLLQHVHEGWGLTAGEWPQNQDRVAAVLENLSRMLSFNEPYEMDNSFQTSFVQVRRPHCDGFVFERVGLFFKRVSISFAQEDQVFDRLQITYIEMATMTVFGCESRGVTINLF